MFLSNITIIMGRTPLQPNADARAVFIKTPPSNKCKRLKQATGVSIWYAFTDEIFGQSNCRLLNHVTLTYTTYHLTVIFVQPTSMSQLKSLLRQGRYQRQKPVPRFIIYTQMGINCDKRMQKKKKSTNAMTSHP